ncbi:3D domain-containing protein [Lactococcus ileimucosae]|uniref:3D domain-containing protein n=1 Tax=Lactococcus ileimucosae TaxID=2941329 RepID=UPI002044562A|nr:3D domain-containing protein [Lactococcus ileimucosae]
MKKKNWKKKAAVLFLAVSMLTLGLQTAQADESSIETNIENFQKQLNAELSQVNAIYAKANDSQTELKATQEKLEHLTAEIEKTEEKYNSLKETVAGQMRAMQQRGGVFPSVLDIMLNAADFHEAVQALTNLRVILHAEDAQAKSLVDTQKNLEKMKLSLLEAKTELEAAQTNYEKQVEKLEESIALLKNKVTDNQSILDEMRVKAVVLNRDSDKSKIDSLSVDRTEDSEVSDENNAVMTPPSGGAFSLTVSATAYASDNGLGFITATGINLHLNPMCIAVDPSVIPLGTMVEVPGYGIAIAGDTGGAIVGNIIDVHFPTTAQAQAWGRKTLQINVLS